MANRRRDSPCACLYHGSCRPKVEKMNKRLGRLGFWRSEQKGQRSRRTRVTGTEIQDFSLANSPVDSSIDSPIDYLIPYPDTDAGASTVVLSEHDQPVVTISSTSVGLSPSLPIPLPAWVPTRPTINEMLVRAAKARGSSV
ncbi:hypothetical protein LWI29_035077 [Acer saccharum]|uniref:Uncharacterized protein n=1 Tax=Acer saccharum TaxID=4024 RepID=A0AA39SEE0_ACESA|nr:hypothetical protein LWI29_035077 [Acer saccharum]